MDDSIQIKRQLQRISKVNKQIGEFLFSVYVPELDRYICVVINTTNEILGIPNTIDINNPNSLFYSFRYLYTQNIELLQMLLDQSTVKNINMKYIKFIEKIMVTLNHNYPNKINKLASIYKQLLDYYIKYKYVNSNINYSKYDHIYVTSDLHFGHKNILKYEHRDKYLNISTIEQHDQVLINNWNNTVSKNSLVLILGDLSFYNASKTMEIIKQLNGDKILVVGNHDHQYLNKQIFDEDLFIQITPYKELIYNGYYISMMHYPILQYNNMNKSNPVGVHLFGHIHSLKLRLPKNSWNVGVDVNNYTPVLLEDAINIACKPHKLLSKYNKRRKVNTL